MSEPLFAVIGDPHIVTQGYSTTRLLREKIMFLNRTKDLKYVLIPGDITHQAKPEQFKLAKNMLDQLKAPYFCCAGNHDMPLNTTDLSRYRAVFGPEQFATRIGKYNLIVVAPGDEIPFNVASDVKGPSILLSHGWRFNFQDPALKLFYSKYNVKCVFFGHYHTQGHHDVHIEGIRYITCPAYLLGLGRLEDPITFTLVSTRPR